MFRSTAATTTFSRIIVLLAMPSPFLSTIWLRTLFLSWTRVRLEPFPPIMQPVISASSPVALVPFLLLSLVLQALLVMAWRLLSTMPCQLRDITVTSGRSAQSWRPCSQAQYSGFYQRESGCCCGDRWPFQSPFCTRYWCVGPSGACRDHWPWCERADDFRASCE